MTPYFNSTFSIIHSTFTFLKIQKYMYNNMYLHSMVTSTLLYVCSNHNNGSMRLKSYTHNILLNMVEEAKLKNNHNIDIHQSLHEDRVS